MFFSLILENSSGNRIDMTTTAGHYMTSKISDLHPPLGTVSTSSYACDAAADGEFYLCWVGRSKNSHPVVREVKVMN